MTHPEHITQQPHRVQYVQNHYKMSTFYLCSMRAATLPPFPPQTRKIILNLSKRSLLTLAFTFGIRFHHMDT